MINTFGIDVLRQDLIHPRPRTFAGTREIIGIEDAHETSVRFGHFEDLYLRIIYRHVLQFLKLHAVQLGRYTKRTFAHIVQFKVGLNLFLIQRIFSLAQFLGIEPPIPRLQFLTRIVLFEQFLQSCSFTFGCLQGRSPNGLKESVHRLMVLRHAVSKDIVGRVVIAE